MKKLRIMLLCTLAVLMVSACSKTKDMDTQEPEEMTDQEESRGREDVEEVEENPGYHLLRIAGSGSDAEQPVYLLEKDVVGQGVFSSESVSETDTFIADLLMAVIERRGEIPEDCGPYFSDQAATCLQEADWTVLEAEWMSDSYIYDSYYTITWLFGGVGYDFTYSFRPDGGSQAVNMRILIDGGGMIRGIDVDICVPTAESVNGNAGGLFYEGYQERVIEEGLVYQGKILYCFQDEEGGSGQGYDGLLAAGDAAVSAESIGEILLDVLESGGANADRYEEVFGDEGAFVHFQELEWEQLETGWMANRYYDCYYIDGAKENGCVDFWYHFYPDYSGMDTDSAAAVLVRCSVDISDGKLTRSDIMACSMTEEEYLAARTWRGQRVPFIFGSGWLTLSILNEEDQRFDSMSRHLDSPSIGKRLLTDLAAGELGNGETRNLLADKEAVWLADMAGRIADKTQGGWQIREEYDCYYHSHNQQSGLIYYRYYFYWEKNDEEIWKTLILDIWMSESGIESMREGWFMTCGDAAESEDIQTMSRPSVDITPFLSFDWTSDEVLMRGHDIEPEDSARGWVFSLADVDFDGSLELAVVFTANHCGGNSLYIYKQDGGEVFHLADTYATFWEDIVWNDREYMLISPYLDIDLLDAYVNEEGRYRYLSLDYSVFGGNVHGDWGSLTLYSTEMGEESEPMELLKILYYCPSEEWELYFQGERVYEQGRLRDLLAEYMDGYTAVEIEYRTLDVFFPREVVALEEDEKMPYLEELREALAFVDG